MLRHLLFCGCLAALSPATLHAATGPDTALARQMDEYLRPYVEGHNFSGVVLVTQDGRPLFQRAYGSAVVAFDTPNTLDTRFHVASLSMQFTAAAVMKLVEAGQFQLDTPVAKLVPDAPHGAEITVRELLTETSGLPDINDLPDYATLLLSPQTPNSLVQKIAGKPLLFPPGSRYQHEEHSAYNLLALIVEKTTHLDFATALQSLVFAPLGMRDCGADDSGGAIVHGLAEGHAPRGVRDLEHAAHLDWSAKSGSGSVYCSAPDEARWVDALMHDRLLSRQLRETMLADSQAHLGYGWFVSDSQRLGTRVFYMNGRAPGYAAYLLHVPERDLTVVVLSNIYASVTTRIGSDVAAMALGRPHDPAPAPITLDAAQLKQLKGEFRFGPDFYQPSATVRLRVQDGDAFLEWPDGSLSPLIPVGPDRFIDRAYWEDVQLHRDAKGRITRLDYDRFQGEQQTDD